MPRKASSRSKKTPRAAGAFLETPRLLSSDEKRELILAHAASRAPQDPLQRVSLWAGVTIAAMVIAGGWFMTVGWQVRRSLSGGGEDVREMTRSLDEFTEEVQSNPMFQQAPLDGPTSQAAASELSDRIKTLLQDGASTTRTGDLLAPSAPVQGTPTDLTPSSSNSFSE